MIRLVKAEQSNPDSIQIMDLETGEIKSEKGRGNDRPGNIDWSPNSEYIITPNMNNGATIYDTETMSIYTQISGQHVSDITCVKSLATIDLLPKALAPHSILPDTLPIIL